MAKFNVIQKQRKARVQERKRAVHGDPNTGKLKHQTVPISISGKRKRKLLKRWQREQKEAIEKGLVTMEDVEMAVAEGSSQSTTKKPKMNFHLKGSKLKLKRLRGKGKNKRKSTKSPTTAPVDAMIE